VPLLSSLKLTHAIGGQGEIIERVRKGGINSNGSLIAPQLSSSTPRCAKIVPRVVWATDRLLGRLAGFANTLAHRSIDAKDPIPLGNVPDEIAPIIAAISALIGRHQKAVDRQRRFSPMPQVGPSRRPA